jgi:putative hydrolase of the HAD superfamily
MIKTIIFDLGGVYFTDGTKNAIIRISNNYHLPEEKVKEVLKGELGAQYRTGAITEQQFWQKAKKIWNINASNNNLRQIWLEGYEPIKGTVAIVDRLREAGYELTFLSDNVQERVDYLQGKYHFLEKFRAGVFSHIAKIKKPDVKIYMLALENSTSTANECVYIDDKPKFIEPAVKLGMKGIVFLNPAQLEKDLKNLGLNF